MKSQALKIFLAKIKFILSRKIQKLKKRQLYTEIQKQIFNDVNIGEVIYAEMPFKDSKLFEIPEGHRTRPYIVVKKNKKNLICYPASHTLPKGIIHGVFLHYINPEMKLILEETMK